MEDIAGVESVGGVVREHGWKDGLMLDQTLYFGYFLEISLMSGGSGVVVVGEIVGVEVGTGFDHSLEVFVVLAVAQELYCHLFEQHFVALHPQ